MSNMPSNSDKKNHQGTNTDTSVVLSVSAGGAGTHMPNPPVAVGTGNKIATRADGALYDTVAGAYIAIQNTNVGTTLCPKNGQ